MAKRTDHALRLTFLIIGTFLFLLASLVYCKLQARITYVCANSQSCINDLSGKKEANNQGTFMGHMVTAPTLPERPLFALTETQNVLGQSTVDNKHIFVDLNKQKLFAYEGNSRVFEFDISSGKWGKTPTGNFRIWIWLRYTRMTGGEGATFYDLPNVPYTMFFYNNDIPKSYGYALHGAYWHNNFGHPMSHGCVNLRIDDAAKLFYWTNPNAKNSSYPTKDNPGTLITIYGTPPED